MSDLSNRDNAPEKKIVWNSLEVAKLLVSAATPFVVALIGWAVWGVQQDLLHKTKSLEEQQARVFADEQKERESLRALRLTIYREVAPPLNDIYAYHFYIGRYREFSPSDMVAKKRKLDSLMYSHESLLTPKFFALYRDFMNAAFETPKYWSGESLLRAPTKCRAAGEGERFTNEDNRENVCVAYRDLLSGVAGDLLLQTVPPNSSTRDQKIKMCAEIYPLNSCP